MPTNTTTSPQHADATSAGPDDDPHTEPWGPPPPPEGERGSEAIKTTGRIVAVLAGVVGAIVAAYFCGFVLTVRGCADPIEEGSTFICDNLAAFVPWAGGLIALVAVLGPLCGGIATCVTGKVRWVAYGAACFAVGCVLMGLLSCGLLTIYTFN